MKPPLCPHCDHPVKHYGDIFRKREGEQAMTFIECSKCNKEFQIVKTTVVTYETFMIKRHAI